MKRFIGFAIAVVGMYLTFFEASRSQNAITQVIGCFLAALGLTLVVMSFDRRYAYITLKAEGRTVIAGPLPKKLPKETPAVSCENFKKRGYSVKIEQCSHFIRPSAAVYPSMEKIVEQLELLRDPQNTDKQSYSI